MKKIMFFCILITSITTSIPAIGKKIVQGSLPQFISTRDQFENFWNNARNKNFSKRIELFDQMVVLNNIPIYRDMVEKKPEDLKKREKKTLSSINEKDAAIILNNFSIFEDAIPRQVYSFKLLFKDAKLNTKFWLGVSLRFNGKVSYVDFGPLGKHIITGFGMEHFMTSQQKDIDIVISHELTHIYRSEILKEPPDYIKMMVKVALSEGIATYTSGVLNNTEDYSTILFDEKLAHECKTNFQYIAKEFIKEIDQTGTDQHNKWFSTKPKNSNVPMRSGYCVGLRVVEKMVNKRPLDQVIQMPWNKVQNEFIATLNNLLN